MTDESGNRQKSPDSEIRTYGKRDENNQTSSNLDEPETTGTYRDLVDRKLVLYPE